MKDIKDNKGMLNTTINSDVLINFRNYCKELGIPMNLVLESFMRQFYEGQFCFKLSKNKAELDIEE